MANLDMSVSNRKETTNPGTKTGNWGHSVSLHELVSICEICKCGIHDVMCVCVELSLVQCGAHDSLLSYCRSLKNADV